MAEPDRTHGWEVADCRAPKVATKPLGEQQKLGEAELCPRGIRFGVEPTSDNLDRFAGPREERVQFRKR
jgi:hypothetical protein